jgi:uroporphyrinogen decarboxylase
MTDRERVEALLKRDKPDRVPICPFSYGSFAAINSGYDVVDMYTDFQKALNAERWTSQLYGWVSLPLIGYASYGAWEFGGEVRYPSSEFEMAPTVMRNPVETEEDGWNLSLPDIPEAGFIPHQTEFYKLSAQGTLDNEPFNVAAKTVGPFTTATNLCGADKFCRWMIKKPDLAHHLLRLATDHFKETLQYWKDTFGTDGVLGHTGEATSSNQLISPKMFENFAFPYLKEGVEHFLSLGFKHVFIHICGEQNANLKYWSQISFGDPGIISIGHEIDIETAAEHFPNDIILGNVEPAIIQTGSPQDVYGASRKVIEKGKNCPGGFILSPGCEMPPRANPVNVWMMTKAANDFGWYD